MENLRYSVPDMHCGHCKAAITAAISAVPGVVAVDIDLGAKRVQVTGSGIDDDAVRAAIGAVGYEVAS